MRIGVLGINHKLASLQLREAIAKTCQKYFNNDKISHSYHSFVLLSTCNRTEVYFCSDDLSATHSYILQILRHEIDEDFDQKIYSFFGYDCFFHLACVTAGLDSAVIAETEIQGQVKTSYETAVGLNELPKELHFIFQKSLQIGKKARQHTLFKGSNQKLEYAILELCQTIQKPNPSILFVGASQTNYKLIQYLMNKSIRGRLHLCNRTDAKSKKWSEELNIQALSWKLLPFWTTFDIVICATKAPYYLLEPSPNFYDNVLIDLSVPRNINPELAKSQTLINIDQLQERLKKYSRNDHSLHEVECLISNSILQHMRSWANRELFRQKLASALA